MPKWQYLVVPSDQAEATQHVQETFTQYGEDGWELSCMTSKFFVFKKTVDASLNVHVDGNPTTIDELREAMGRPTGIFNA